MMHRYFCGELNLLQKSGSLKVRCGRVLLCLQLGLWAMSANLASMHTLSHRQLQTESFSVVIQSILLLSGSDSANA